MEQFHTLDVFTTTGLEGNPLAVFPDGGWLSDEAMQKLAREMNLSETVFVTEPVDPANDAALRIFTPVRELAFAGHPLIGTSILLADLRGMEPGSTLNLELASGVVPVQYTRRNDEAYAIFTAPQLPTVRPQHVDNATIARAIGVDVDSIGFSAHIPRHSEAGGTHFFYVPLNDWRLLADLALDSSELTGMDMFSEPFGLYVFAATDGDTPDARPGDYRARMFSGRSGLPEDPATGSAAVALTGHLMESGVLGIGKYDFSVQQGVECGRPSKIDVMVRTDLDKIIEVRIGGHAVRVSDSTLRLDQDD